MFRNVPEIKENIKESFLSRVHILVEHIIKLDSACQLFLVVAIYKKLTNKYPLKSSESKHLNVCLSLETEYFYWKIYSNKHIRGYLCHLEQPTFEQNLL